MNHLVEIKYGKCEKYPKIFINGEAISRYMSLSDYIYDDIFCWAEDFFDIMDSELAEEYRVSLVGHPYHEIVLRKAMEKSEYCKEIVFAENEYRISIGDKYRYLLELNKKHSLIPGMRIVSVEFLCKEPERVAKCGVPGICFATEDSDYSICFDATDAGSFLGKFRIIIAEEDKVVRQRDVYYFYVTKDHLHILVDYFNTYHVRISAIERMVSRLSDHPLDELSMLEFEAYNKEEYRVYVGEIPTLLESGKTFAVEMDYFPKCFADPKIKLTSSDHSVVSYENGAWTAKATGVSTLSVTDAAGKIYKSENVEVFRHNYITNISISLPTTSMRIGDTIPINTVVTPSDAEDIGEVVYRVSDESVVVFNGQNYLHSLKTGRVRVTVATPRIEKSVYVTVMPQPTGLEVSGESVELPHPAEAVIYCAVEPAEATQNANVTWVVPSNGVIRIKASSSKKCCIESVGEGTAALICRINGTNIVKRINVTVTKPNGCYVATAVYGSYDCPEVWVLRRFRDNYLKKHWLGRRFIDTYYAVSPTAVDLFGKKRWFGKVFRGVLDNFVGYLKEKGYEESPYMD